MWFNFKKLCRETEADGRSPGYLKLRVRCTPVF